MSASPDASGIGVAMFTDHDYERTGGSVKRTWGKLAKRYDATTDAGRGCGELSREQAAGRIGLVGNDTGRIEPEAADQAS